MTASTHSDLAVVTRILRQARPYWSHIGAIFLLDLLATPLALLTPIPLMVVVDSVISNEPLPALLTTMTPAAFTASSATLLVFGVSLVVVFALLSKLQQLGVWLLQTYTGEKLVLNFRSRLIRHAQRLSLAYHDSKGTADSIYRVQYDAPYIQWTIIYGVSPIATAILTLIGMIIVTLNIDWQLALIALVVAPAVVFFTQFFRSRLRRQWTEVKELETGALSVVQEVLTALRVVRAFGQEHREEERFVKHSVASVWARIRAAITEGAFSISVGLTLAVGTALVLFFGAKHVQAGLLTLGELLLVMSYLGQLYQPLQSIGQQMASLQSGLASAERAFALLDEAPDVPDAPDAMPLDHARGDIEFDNVSFSYGDEQPVLEHITVIIPAGTRVGIVGETGAGKTTLINLLPRFFDPVDGQIRLDGTDLRYYQQADLRNQFSIVLQDTVLFSTSIAENIAYGRPATSMEDIVRAAKAANAHDFISALPEGYNTLVGERGMRLSGGERQRIALARAFLKDAPILILDEPTSSIDVKTEAEIMDSMEQLMQGRTVFMIAHRLSTLDCCDRIYQISNGHLCEVGTSEDRYREAR